MTPVERSAARLLALAESGNSISEELVVLRSALQIKESQEHREVVARQPSHGGKTLHQLIAQAHAMCDGPQLCRCGAVRDYVTGEIDSLNKCKEEGQCDFISHFGRHIIRMTPMSFIGELVDRLEVEYKLPESSTRIAELTAYEIGVYISERAKGC